MTEIPLHISDAAIEGYISRVIPGSGPKIPEAIRNAACKAVSKIASSSMIVKGASCTVGQSFVSDGQWVVELNEKTENNAGTTAVAFHGISDWMEAHGGMEKEAKKSLGWSYVSLPDQVKKAMKKIRDRIDPEDLGEEGEENDPHITAKYGLTTTDPDEVRMAVVGNRGGKVRMGKTSLFENDDADVLKVSVTSHALHSLWKSLSELDNEDKHKVYEPHATLAYLKPGTGHKYRGLDAVDGLEFTFDEFVFEDAKDVKTKIKLDGSKPKIRKAAQTDEVVLSAKARDNHGDTFVATLTWKDRTSPDGSLKISEPTLVLSEASGRTYGKWSYWLSSLNEHQTFDRLSLDSGQNWSVTGMKAILEEANAVASAKDAEDRLREKEIAEIRRAPSDPFEEFEMTDFGNLSDFGWDSFAASQQQIRTAQFEELDDEEDFMIDLRSDVEKDWELAQSRKTEQTRKKKEPAWLTDRHHWFMGVVPVVDIDIISLQRHAGKVVVGIAPSSVSFNILPHDKWEIEAFMRWAEVNFEPMAPYYEETNDLIDPLTYYIMSNEDVAILVNSNRMERGYNVLLHMQQHIPIRPQETFTVEARLSNNSWANTILENGTWHPNRYDTETAAQEAINRAMLEVPPDFGVERFRIISSTRGVLTDASRQEFRIEYLGLDGWEPQPDLGVHPTRTEAIRAIARYMHSTPGVSNDYEDFMISSSTSLQPIAISSSEIEFVTFAESIEGRNAISRAKRSYQGSMRLVDAVGEVMTEAEEWARRNGMEQSWDRLRDDFPSFIVDTLNGLRDDRSSFAGANSEDLIAPMSAGRYRVEEQRSTEWLVRGTTDSINHAQIMMRRSRENNNIGFPQTVRIVDTTDGTVVDSVTYGDPRYTRPTPNRTYRVETQRVGTEDWVSVGTTEELDPARAIMRQHETQNAGIDMSPIAIRIVRLSDGEVVESTTSQQPNYAYRVEAQRVGSEQWSTVGSSNSVAAARRIMRSHRGTVGYPTVFRIVRLSSGYIVDSITYGNPGSAERRAKNDLPAKKAQFEELEDDDFDVDVHELDRIMSTPSVQQPEAATAETTPENPASEDPTSDNLTVNDLVAGHTYRVTFRTDRPPADGEYIGMRDDGIMEFSVPHGTGFSTHQSAIENITQIDPVDPDVEVFQLLRKSGDTWDRIGRFTNLNAALMGISSMTANGENFFDIAINSSVCGAIELFMIQLKAGGSWVHPRAGRQVVFDNYGEAFAALDGPDYPIDSREYRIVGNQSDNPANLRGRYILQRRTTRGWIAATSGGNPASFYNYDSARRQKDYLLRSHPSINPEDVRLFNSITGTPVDDPVWTSDPDRTALDNSSKQIRTAQFEELEDDDLMFEIQMQADKADEAARRYHTPAWNNGSDPDANLQSSSDPAGGSICQRCDSPLENGFCTDETCLFNHHLQECRNGWRGHPEMDVDELIPCLCSTSTPNDSPHETVPEGLVIPQSEIRIGHNTVLLDNEPMQLGRLYMVRFVIGTGTARYIRMLTGYFAGIADNGNLVFDRDGAQNQLGPFYMGTNIDPETTVNIIPVSGEDPARWLYSARQITQEMALGYAEYDDEVGNFLVTLTPANYWNANHHISDEEDDEMVDALGELDALNPVGDNTHILAPAQLSAIANDPRFRSSFAMSEFLDGDGGYPDDQNWLENILIPGVEYDIRYVSSIVQSHPEYRFRSSGVYRDREGETLQFATRSLPVFTFNVPASWISSVSPIDNTPDRRAKNDFPIKIAQFEDEDDDFDIEFSGAVAQEQHEKNQMLQREQFIVQYHTGYGWIEVRWNNNGVETRPSRYFTEKEARNAIDNDLRESEGRFSPRLTKSSYRVFSTKRGQLPHEPVFVIQSKDGFANSVMVRQQNILDMKFSDKEAANELIAEYRRSNPMSDRLYQKIISLRVVDINNLHMEDPVVDGSVETEGDEIFYIQQNEFGGDGWEFVKDDNGENISFPSQTQATEKAKLIHEEQMLRLSGPHRIRIVGSRQGLVANDLEDEEGTAATGHVAYDSMNPPSGFTPPFTPKYYNDVINNWVPLSGQTVRSYDTADMAWSRIMAWLEQHPQISRRKVTVEDDNRQGLPRPQAFSEEFIAEAPGFTPPYTIQVPQDDNFWGAIQASRETRLETQDQAWIYAASWFPRDRSLRSNARVVDANGWSIPRPPGWGEEESMPATNTVMTSPVEAYEEFANCPAGRAVLEEAVAAVTLAFNIHTMHQSVETVMAKAYEWYRKRYQRTSGWEESWVSIRSRFAFIARRFIRDTFHSQNDSPNPLAGNPADVPADVPDDDFNIDLPQDNERSEQEYAATWLRELRIGDNYEFTRVSPGSFAYGRGRLTRIEFVNPLQNHSNLDNVVLHFEDDAGIPFSIPWIQIVPGSISDSHRTIRRPSPDPDRRAKNDFPIKIAQFDELDDDFDIAGEYEQEQYERSLMPAKSVIDSSETPIVEENPDGETPEDPLTEEDPLTDMFEAFINTIKGDAALIAAANFVRSLASDAYSEANRRFLMGSIVEDVMHAAGEWVNDGNYPVHPEGWEEHFRSSIRDFLAFLSANPTPVVEESGPGVATGVGEFLLNSEFQSFVESQEGETALARATSFISTSARLNNYDSDETMDRALRSVMTIAQTWLANRPYLFPAGWVAYFRGRIGRYLNINHPNFNSGTPVQSVAELEIGRFYRWEKTTPRATPSQGELIGINHAVSPPNLMFFDTRNLGSSFFIPWDQIRMGTLICLN